MVRTCPCTESPYGGDVTTSAARPDIGRDELIDTTPVAADRGRAAGRTLVGGMVDVGQGQVRPARLIIHADRVAARVDRLHQDGADAAHRIDDQVVGGGVALDGVPGDGCIFPG